MRAATYAARRAVSLPPCSIACRAWPCRALFSGRGRVEVAHLGVEVPAVVVEPARDRLDVRERLLLDVLEAHDDVRDLHPRVVDVVLDADVVAAVPEQAHERVAEAGVAHVPDVGGLVGVDRGVLDDHVPRPRLRSGAAGQARVELPREGAALQEQVDVAGPGHLRADDPWARAQPDARAPLGDLTRLAAERLGEIERNREREIAQVDAGWVLE